MKESIEINQFEPEKIEEMDFENGCQQVVLRIEKLLSEKELVTVGFNATGPNVGKTMLLKRLSKEMEARGIYIWSFHDFNPGIANVKALKERFDWIGDKKKVVIFDEIDCGVSLPPEKLDIVKNHRDVGAKDLFKQMDRDISGIDIWIGICRPDKPFAQAKRDGSTTEILADVLINNKLAVDKK